MFKRTDLIWLLAYPIYQLIGTLRHEASHAVAAFLEGATIHQLVFWPTLHQEWGFRWGYVNHVGDTGWLTQMAPYLADTVTFALFFAACMWIPFKRRWIWLNAVIIGLISPLLNSLYNYLGKTTPTNDVGRLLHLLPAAPVHAFLIASLLSYAIGLFIVFRYSRTARLDIQT